VGSTTSFDARSAETSKHSSPCIGARRGDLRVVPAHDRRRGKRATWCKTSSSAWERLTSFRGQSSLGTWLHRLGVNVVLERIRSTKRDAARLIEGDDATFGSHSSDPAIDASIDLDAALVHLPRGARTVFVLHDIEGYSHDEIALMTGIAAGTARAQLWRARRALMRLLDP
jgi:RNA polymerase sigma-70 factor (ECF subfamily)